MTKTAAPEMTNIKPYLEKIQLLTNELLDKYLPSDQSSPKRLHEAMRYSTLASGKRLRPILAYTAYEYCGGKLDGDDLPIYNAMAALEMVHTYSLIHDDLPCMDDDDLRRGIPTCHKKYGLATAVLAGDALHDIAYALLAKTGSTEVVTEMAEAIGTYGMIGGQIKDVEAEGEKVDRERITDIHNRKTGALINCSIKIGAILAESDKNTYKRLSLFGEKIGLAFQIIDDILDIEGDQALLGKTVGADSNKQKATYPGAVGMDQAKEDAEKLIKSAIELFPADEENYLKLLAQYIAQRNK